MKLKLGILFTLLAVIVAAGGFLLGRHQRLVKEAKASWQDRTGKTWSISQWSGWDECRPVAECGTTEGTQTNEYYRTCVEWFWGESDCDLGDRLVLNTQTRDCVVETPACPVDQCDNLEGFQEDVPEGYTQEEIEKELICTPIPSPSPSPSPTIMPEQPRTEQPLTQAGPPSVPACEVPVWAPTVTEVGRIDGDSVFARWTEVADWVNHYVVWFGTSQDNLPWNTIVEGEYVELNSVSSGHIWLKVAGVDNGCVGPFSVTTDP